MATSMASRGSMAVLSLCKLSTATTKASIRPARILLSNNLICRRFLGDTATAKQEEPESSDQSPRNVKPAVSPAVSTTHDISSLQRVEKCVNMCQLMGRIGSEPQMRGTEQHPVLLFSLATHTQYRDESGSLQQKTFWHRVAVFKGGLRETCFKYCRKGQRVYLTGEIQYNNVKDPETNFVRTVTSIVADDVVMLGGNNTPAS
jgi:single-strand DNA-binding protein